MYHFLEPDTMIFDFFLKMIITTCYGAWYYLELATKEWINKKKRVLQVGCFLHFLCLDFTCIYYLFKLIFLHLYVKYMPALKKYYSYFSPNPKNLMIPLLFTCSFTSPCSYYFSPQRRSHLTSRKDLLKKSTPALRDNILKYVWF